MADIIFPTGEPRDGYILRLELVGSWESALLGLGRLAAFLTPRLLSEAHAVDDMGVNVVFLQRHRVEVGLKLILERAGADPLVTHGIGLLRTRCAKACAAMGAPSCWNTFDNAQAEFAELLDRVDPAAAMFRYPVDRENQPWNRGNVDLVALEEAGAAFQRDVLVVVGELAAMELLPIAEPDAVEAAEELRALSVLCPAFIRSSREVLERLRQQRQALSSVILGPRAGGPEPGDDAYPEHEALEEASEAMVRGAETLLARLVVAYGIDLEPTPTIASVGSLAPLDPFASPGRKKEAFDAQITWSADQMLPQLRALTASVNAVYHRSHSWETPAARQVHLDVARFRSRLVRTRISEKAVG
jgi:hypothetical protein